MVSNPQVTPRRNSQQVGTTAQTPEFNNGCPQSPFPHELFLVIEIGSFLGTRQAVCS
jgi:hypothetical protein